MHKHNPSLESEMESVSYTPSAYWVADLLLKINACVGVFEGLQDDNEQREHQLRFGQLLAHIAGTPLGPTSTLQVDQVRCAVHTASQIRRAITAQFRVASSMSIEDHTLQFPLAAYDLLSSAARDIPVKPENSEIQPSRREGTPRMSEHVPRGTLESCRELLVLSENTMHLLNSGMSKLRSLLNDVTLAYVDMQTTEQSANALDILCGRQTMTLVRNALNARAIACMFDSVRISAGIMAASHALGIDFAGAIPDVNRAAIGRADAYAVQRLYRGLELLVAAMMMGQARRAEEDGDRSKWTATDTGQAVLKLRHDIGEVLTAYDSQKRTVAAKSGKTYSAQTPGYVALLQEQAASIMLKAQEPNNQLHRAIVDALGLPQLFRTQCVEGDKLSFWQAVSEIQAWREHSFSATNDRRVAPISNAIAMVAASAVMSSTDRELNLPVYLTSSAYDAMRAASKEWPPISNFYGKEYALTERKVMAKAAKQSRDVREVGEALGYRTEWVGFLSGQRDCKRQSDKGSDADMRFGGAVTTLAHAEGLRQDVGANVLSSVLPAPYGAALHNLHGVALSMEPLLLRSAIDSGSAERSHIFEHADAHYNELMNAFDERLCESHADPDAYQRVILDRRSTIQDRIERISTSFKGWSGAAVATDLYHAFFLEVWRRFNANLRASNSSWNDTINAWIEHYKTGTTPNRSSSHAKLMHPWRCMYLQRGVARALLDEWFGEQVVEKISSAEGRCAVRIQRSMISSVVSLYDYGPWASHVMRRFCSIDERKYGGAPGKRVREE